MGVEPDLVTDGLGAELDRVTDGFGAELDRVTDGLGAELDRVAVGFGAKLERVADGRVVVLDLDTELGGTARVDGRGSNVMRSRSAPLPIETVRVRLCELATLCPFELG